MDLAYQRALKDGAAGRSVVLTLDDVIRALLGDDAPLLGAVDIGVVGDRVSSSSAPAISGGSATSRIRASMGAAAAGGRCHARDRRAGLPGRRAPRAIGLGITDRGRSRGSCSSPPARSGTVLAGQTTQPAAEGDRSTLGVRRPVDPGLARWRIHGRSAHRDQRAAGRRRTAIDSVPEVSHIVRPRSSSGIRSANSHDVQ